MVFFIVFVCILAVLFLVINFLFAPHNPYQEKYSIFECGWACGPSGRGRVPGLQIKINRVIFIYWNITNFLSAIFKHNNDLTCLISLWNYYIGDFQINYLCSDPQTNLLIFESSKVAVHVQKYSTLIKNSNQNAQLDPWFITGFVDGEGCFIIGITKSSSHKAGYQVRVYFSIEVHKKDELLLERIKNSLGGVGKITKHRPKSVQLRVTNQKEIAEIIEHFNNYRLINQKFADFELLKLANNLIQNKQHVTVDGLKKIVALRRSINWGRLLPDLERKFSDVIPAVRPLVKDQTIKNPNWLAGFAAAEGCFHVSLKKSKTNSTGFQVYLEFRLTQHQRDEQLIISFREYFNCGNIYKNREVFEYSVSKLDDLTNKIIPFFKIYKIQGVKAKDFEDWCKVAYMMKQKKHLTKEGLEQIKKIKAEINSERKFGPNGNGGG